MARTVKRVWRPDRRKSVIHGRSSWSPWREAGYLGAIIGDAIRNPTKAYDSSIARKGPALARRGQVRTGTRRTSTGGRRSMVRVENVYQWIKVPTGKRRVTPVRRRR
jgi:hypothetical protein